MPLSPDDALAYTEHYAEFQEGSVIIRVDFPPHGDRGEWLSRATKAYLYTWQDLDKIVAFARTHLRSMQLARWRLYDLAGLRDTALIPYGIWIDPTDDSSSCHVSCNYEAKVPPGLPALTEADFVMVQRSATGWLTIGSAGHTREVPSRPLPLRCPCCYCKTLKQRAIYAICPVCYWEDDGQDDHDADATTGGPNHGLSLTQGRINYQAFGASRQKDLKHVRAPRPHELPDVE